MTVSYFHANNYMLGVQHILFFLYSVTIVGLNPANYSVAEDAGSVNVTLSLLRGTLAQGFSVVLVTSFSDGTATGGIVFVAFWY